MIQYHRCLICLGSNQKGSTHLKIAEKELESIAYSIHWGDIVETVPENSPSPAPYQNRAALLQTTLNKESLLKEFKEIECRHGRTLSGKRNGIIPLDIDLLIYDEEIIKPDDLTKLYVRQALQSVSY